MTAPWIAEHRIPDALAAQLIGDAFPALRPVRLELLGEGWDNVAYLVDGELIFRFPRRQAAVPLLEREHRLLPALAPRLPLAIPVPELFGRAGAGPYRWPFLGYRRVAGETACRANLDDRERRALAAPLARFLAALHAFPTGEARRLGMPPDSIGKLDLAARIPQARERLERMRALGLLRDVRPWSELLEAGAALRASEDLRVVHGDLYARHLLVSAGPARALCGVIDWGDLHLGDPAVDLSVAHSVLPPEAHDTFRATYGEIDARRWELARIRAIHHSAAVVLYGHDIGDSALVREGLRIFR
ncbi:phosphotransferase [Sorangium cellulosum]|jgi:aminoglycoside phosphotransferase (APT) family kinase protein|uniref:Phosphotransferase n=1 Tax=Sorangium cellulosum TaxID=56 RepID=A0A4P2Q5N0_SORCE|nr:phosphotransferase [Sorangium cellulosum]AUX24386.1 phosphotransferase [Sorangium cellulosum]